MATLSVTGNNASYTLKLSDMSTSTRYHVFTADLNSDGTENGKWVCRRSSVGSSSAWSGSYTSSSSYAVFARRVLWGTSTASTRHSVGSSYTYAQIADQVSSITYAVIGSSGGTDYTMTVGTNLYGVGVANPPVVARGKKCVFTATAIDGYEFSYWYDNDEQESASTSNPWTVSAVYFNYNVTPIFKKTTTTYTISTECGTGVSSISPTSATVASGGTKTFTATLKSAYTSISDGEDSGGFDTEMTNTYSMGYTNCWTRSTTSMGTLSSTSGTSTTLTVAGDGTLKATARTVGSTTGYYYNHITYMANGGTGDTFRKYTARSTASTGNKTITIAANSFSKTGYTFKNWNTASDGTGTAYTVSQSTRINANIILYAQWTSSTQYLITTSKGTGVTKIEPSSKYVYGGADQTFTATLTDPFNVISSGNDDGGYDTQQLRSYSMGYNNCWTVSPTTAGHFSTTSSTTTVFTPSAAATITATPRASDSATGYYGHHFTYNANEGSGTMAPSYSTNLSTTTSGSTSTTVSANSFTRTGYIFKGWNTKADGSGSTYSSGSTYQIVKNIILYAQWRSDVQYTIEVACGDYVDDIDPWGATVYAGDSKTFQAILEDGWDVWYSGSDYGGYDQQYYRHPVMITNNSWTVNPTTAGSFSTTADPTTVFTPTANCKITATARLSDRAYEIYRHHFTYYPNGGSGTIYRSYSTSVSSSSTPTQITIAANSYTRTNYEFTGWNTAADGSGISYQPNETIGINKNVILYAQWRSTIICTISTTCGDNVTSITPSSASVRYGSSQSFTAAVKASTHKWTEGPTYDTYYRTDYNIYSGGWTVSPERAGDLSSTEGLTVSFSPIADATLTATARGSDTAEEYRNHIVYDANGGSGTMDKTYSTSASTSSASKSITTSLNSFIYLHKTFKNWNTKSDGSGTSYAAGRTYSISENLTLYAQWQGATTDYFWWDGNDGSRDSSIIYSGGPSNNLTAEMWNRLNAKIKVLNPSHTYTEITSGTSITDTKFNEVRNAINNLSGHGPLPSTVDKGDTIYAAYFISSTSLRDAINTAIDNT